MPKRYMAVDRFSATLLTPNSLLALVLAMDSAAPAHACTKMRKDRMAMFLHLSRSGQFLGSSGSSSPDVTTRCRPFSSTPSMCLSVWCRPASRVEEDLVVWVLVGIDCFLTSSSISLPSLRYCT